MTSFINIGGLAIGITAAVLILFWVQNELNFDGDHPNADHIFRVTTSIKENNWIWESSPLLLAEAAKKQVPEIEKVARLNTSNWPVFKINGNLAYEKKVAYVDDDWFSIFNYSFLDGNAASFKRDPNGIILTAATAEKYFGKSSALGATIRIDSMNYEVKGIVKNAPSNSSFQFDAYLPLAALLADPNRKQNDENWDNFNYITFIQLRPGSNTNATAKKLAHILPGNNEEGTTISLTPLKDMHFDTEVQFSSFVLGSKNTVYVFSILAFLLLLIASINYVNLTIAKASLRAKEVSVRKMVGAKRIDLFYQFIAESLLTSLISLFITLVLIRLSLPLFNNVTGKAFDLDLSSPSVWLVIGVTLLAAFTLTSIYPALMLSTFKPLNVFRGFTVLRVKDTYFRKGLVVVQFTISVMLISATIIIYSQMRFVQQTNPGYNRSQVLSFPLPMDIDMNKKESSVQSIKQELLGKTSIQSVTLSNQPIINIGSISTGSADWNGHDTTFNPKIAQLSTDADFQKTMQLQMREGRWLEHGNEADKNNVVLNETAIKELNIPRPYIGQRFTFKGRTGQIVGIVKDFTYKSFHEKTGPLVAFTDPAWFSYFTVRIAAGNVTKAIADVQSTWNKTLPGRPLEYNFLDDSFDNLYKEDQQASFLIFLLAIIAVVISSLGLFGLAAFTAEQRTKEMGIRKVLGATIGNITALLSKDFVKLVCISILVATPVAFWAMHQWIQSFAYRINITWWMFAAAGLLALLIALLTTCFQAIKTALANPVKALRTE
ncbi:ABC transporter permease [Segetibacter aerophilus]|nr:ABC transporter permease [Segetibacter aerophilus]